MAGELRLSLGALKRLRRELRRCEGPLGLARDSISVTAAVSADAAIAQPQPPAADAADAALAVAAVERLEDADAFLVAQRHATENLTAPRWFAAGAAAAACEVLEICSGMRMLVQRFFPLGFLSNLSLLTSNFMLLPRRSLFGFRCQSRDRKPTKSPEQRNFST